MNLLITLSCCRSDVKQAYEVLKLIKDFGNVSSFDFLFSYTPGAARVIPPAEFQVLARPVFKSVTLHSIQDEVEPRVLPDGKRDWTPNNTMFRRVADFIKYQTKADAFYFMEPDVVPLTPEWALRLEAGYVSETSPKRPFFGARRPTKNDAGVLRGTHMNGSGIYPKDVSRFTPASLQVVLLSPEQSIPWDVAASEQVQPFFQETDLIYVNLTKEQVSLKDIPERALLFHGDKSGSLIPQLREKWLGQPAQKVEKPIKVVTPKPLPAVETVNAGPVKVWDESQKQVEMPAPRTIKDLLTPTPIPKKGNASVEISSLVNQLKVVCGDSSRLKEETRVALVLAGLIRKKSVKKS